MVDGPQTQRIAETAGVSVRVLLAPAFTGLKSLDCSNFGRSSPGKLPVSVLEIRNDK